ncbi:MAG: BolA family protein [Gammaproteobacteria bacterium]
MSTRLDFIKEKLKEGLQPSHLEVQDDSAAHKGHAEAPDGGGSHFSVFIVSAAFKDKSPVERHRMVYLPLGEAVGREIHALSIRALSPEELDT